nr:intercellular adhesion molecule 3 isoform X1 [Oryctolagus cuniculus]
MAPSGACWILLLCGCLLPPGVQGQEFPLRVEPRDPVLRAGASLLVNCSTDCPDSDLITLETLLSKELVGQGQGWVAFLLSGASDDSQVLCSGYCNGSQMTSTSHITVYEFPERVELAPLPPWQPVGEDLTLRCQVVGGQPRARLSVLLLRGEEELSRQPALGEPVEVTATVRADRSDHGANFSCVTELDLRPLGLELFKNVSAPRQLQTFVLPLTPPSLAVFPLLEVGTSWPVVCHLSGLFPASAAQVRLALGDQMLNPQVTRDGDALNATAIVTERSGHEGAREVVCSVTLAGRSREARKNVTVYSFLGPFLNLSEPIATEGSSVTVTCTAGARVQLVLDGVRAAAPGQPVHLQLNATERDDGRSFSCGATLQVDGHFVHRNRSARLRVLSRGVERKDDPRPALRGSRQPGPPAEVFARGLQARGAGRRPVPRPVKLQWHVSLPGGQPAGHGHPGRGDGRSRYELLDRQHRPRSAGHPGPGGRCSGLPVHLRGAETERKLPGEAARPLAAPPVHAARGRGWRTAVLSRGQKSAGPSAVYPRVPYQ